MSYSSLYRTDNVQLNFCSAVDVGNLFTLTDQLSWFVSTNPVKSRSRTSAYFLPISDVEHEQEYFFILWSTCTAFSVDLGGHSFQSLLNRHVHDWTIFTFLLFSFSEIAPFCCLTVCFWNIGHFHSPAFTNIITVLLCLTQIITKNSTNYPSRLHSLVCLSQNYNFSWGFVWVWSLISDIKEYT